MNENEIAPTTYEPHPLTCPHCGEDLRLCQPESGYVNRYAREGIKKSLTQWQQQRMERRVPHE